jgi:hypothetical protein
MESKTRPNEAHRESGQGETLDPVKVAPTSLHGETCSRIEDYELKVRLKK